MTPTPTTPRAPVRAAEPVPFAPIPAPTPILVDLFPAEVLLPPVPAPPSGPDDPDLSSRISPARVIITADPASFAPAAIYVFTDSSAGPALLYSAPAIFRTGTNREGAVTTTADDSGTVTYSRTGGCGCGSALKSFQPFTSPYSVA